MKKLIPVATSLVATLAFSSALAGQTLHLIERPTKETTVDLGAKGDSIGDLLVFANPVFDAANKTQVATDQGFCVRTIVGKTWECMWTLSMKDGMITVEGPFNDSGDSLFVVTGGTGKYAGAKGQMKLHPLEGKPESLDFLYELL